MEIALPPAPSPQATTSGPATSPALRDRLARLATWALDRDQRAQFAAVFALRDRLSENLLAMNLSIAERATALAHQHCGEPADRALGLKGGWTGEHEVTFRRWLLQLTLKYQREFEELQSVLAELDAALQSIATDRGFRSAQHLAVGLGLGLQQAGVANEP